MDDVFRVRKFNVFVITPCPWENLHNRIYPRSAVKRCPRQVPKHTETDCGREHDDVIKWKHFPRCWPFVRRIHRSPVNSTHKSQWRGALVFSLICIWINGSVNYREAGDLRRYRAHYDVIVMEGVKSVSSGLPPTYSRGKNNQLNYKNTSVYGNSLNWLLCRFWLCLSSIDYTPKTLAINNHRKQTNLFVAKFTDWPKRIIDDQWDPEAL